jgi:outer membrane lipoprotein-sorting protein
MKNIQPTLAFLLLLLLCLPCSKEEPITVSQLLDELAQKSESIDSYRVDSRMTQHIKGPDFVKVGDLTITGKMAYKKPGMLHTSTSISFPGDRTKETETFWSDGVMVTYSPLTKTATKMKMSKMGNPQAIGMPDPMATLKDLPQEGIISCQKTFVDGNEVYELRVSPGQPEPANEASQHPFAAGSGRTDYLIHVDNGMPYKIIMYGKDDTPFMEQTYTNYEINVPIPDEEFVFTAPEGVQVMDVTEDIRGMMERMKAKYGAQQMPEK